MLFTRGLLWFYCPGVKGDGMRREGKEDSLPGTQLAL